MDLAVGSDFLFALILGFAAVRTNHSIFHLNAKESLTSNNLSWESFDTGFYIYVGLIIVSTIVCTIY